MKKEFSIILGALIVSSGFFCFLYAGTENVSAQTYVSGNITTNTKWTTTGSPYIIQSDVKVQSGVTLTIDPGVEVKFDGLYSIVVDGTLKAIGNNQNPIIFTSNLSSPKKGDWYTIRLRTSNNIINWAEIDYANYGIFVTYYGGNNKILNTTVNDCLVDGIYITNSDNNTVRNCNITSNNGYGMTLYDSDNTIVENCNINTNVYFGIYFNASTYTKVKNCNISNINGKGIILYSNSHHTRIINCQINNNNNIGIDLSETSNNIIKNTNIIGNTGMGIDFGGKTNNQIIDNCNIKNNGDTGIDLKGSIFINITKCNISKNKGNGGIFSGFPVKDINISNSDIFNNLAGNGVDFNGATNVIFLNIKSIKNVGCGITIGDQLGIDNVIKGSIISDNTAQGIYFQSIDGYIHFDRNNISDNIISRNKEEGIYFSLKGWPSPTANDNKINNNLIHSNKGHGISFISDYQSSVQNNDILKNEIYKNNQCGIYFGSYYHSSTNNNNLIENIIYSNNQHGIYFLVRSSSDANFNKIYSNSIYSNLLHGIFFEVSAGSSRMNYNEILNNTVYLNFNHGICLQASRSGAYVRVNTLIKNTISSNKMTGIFLNATINGFVGENRISDNKIITNNNGILFENSPKNNIINNFISNNNKSGINFRTDSNYNNIKNNNITLNNQSGIIISSNSNNNIIIKNNIANNSIVGLNVTDTNYNKIHHNNFKWNAENGFDSTISMNNWDDGAQGNYWSDYIGTDDNKDGFGEDPYVVPGGGSRDWHPFIRNLNFTPPKIKSVSPVNNSLSVPINTKFSIQFSKQMNTSRVENAISISGDITPINFSWTNADKNVNFDPSISLDYNSSYTITVSKSAIDVDGNELLYDYSWHFKTKKKPTPPTILSHSPTGTDVSVDTNIKVTFSELMDTNSVQNSLSIAPSATGTYSWTSASLTFTPDSALNYNTQYKVTIGTSAKDLENEFLAAVYSWQFTTEMMENPSPPTVIDNSPIGDDVPVDTTITITFSESMNTGSVEGAFAISPSVDGTFDWNNAKFIFIPNNDLEYNTQYSLTMSTTAKDLQNEFLSSKFSWQFTTETVTIDPTPPTIIAHSPTGTNVPVDTKISLTFSELMDTSSVEEAFSIQPSVLGAFSWSNAKLIFTPAQDLKYKMQYTIIMATSAKDLSNEYLESKFTWQFTTTSKTKPDPSTPPTIIDNSPIGKDIPVDTEITLTFSELMATASVEDAFSISPTIIGAFAWTGEKLIFTPEITLDYNTKYTVSIGTAAKDLEDEFLERKFSWTFTTVSEIIEDPLSPPTIIDNSPTGSKVSVESKIKVTFNEPMDTMSAESAFSISPSIDGVFNWANNKMIFSPNEALDFDATYTIIINTKAKDLENLNLESIFTWQFTTIKKGSVDENIVEIRLSTADLEIEVGDSHQFTVTCLDIQGNVVDDLEFSWFVEGDIGKVDDSGIFIAEKEGTGEIIVTSGGETAKGTITVVEDKDVEEVDTNAESPDKANTNKVFFWFWVFGIIILVIILLSIIFVLKNKKRNNNKKDEEK
jgi:parallel beta-helix repeat protein